MAPTRILVAVDFSEPSDRALLRARELHRRLGASVHVLHVILDPFAGLPSWAESALWMTPRQIERERDRIRRQLRHAALAVFGPEARDVEVEAVVARSPGPAILEATERSGADLVCLGATGWGAVERVLLGSVADRVVRASPVPVLIEP